MKKVKNRKKILFLSRLYYPHIGGVEKHVAEVSKILVKKGFSVTVICEQYDKKLKTKEQINKVEVLRIPISLSDKNKKFEIWKWVLRNRKFIKSFDIVHIHDVFFWIMPILFYLDRKKIFITFHGYESYPLMTSSKIQKKFAAKYCKGSIAVGDFINKWYGIASNAVMYGGVNRPKKSSAKPKIQNSAVFFGRLDNQTGIKEYYNAYLRLKRTYENFSFQVVGEGEYAPKLKGLFISPFKSDISKYIQDSRFIFVSRYLSMLEAMVEKRLVFAVYSDPIKRDYLINSPFKNHLEICSSGDEIYEKVKYYLEHPREERKLIESGYKFAKKLTWESVVRDYINLWEETKR